MFAKIFAPLLMLALALPVQAEVGWRTFTNQDGSRTFLGKLMAYDKQTNQVTVQNQQRRAITFSIDLLSEDDRKYVAEAAGLLGSRASLSVRYQQLRELQNANRSGAARNSVSNGGYEITIDNFSPASFRDVVVEYLIIYRKDEAKGSGTNQIVRGSKKIDLEANGTHIIETDTVPLTASFTPGQARSRGGG